MRYAYTNAENKLCIIIPVSKEKLESEVGALTMEEYEERIKRAIPENALHVQKITLEDYPSEDKEDRDFRGAWQLKNGKIEINIEKSKEILHRKRRFAREKEFKPYDDIIAKQIPGESAANAETERAKIRTKYDIMQNQIDDATTIQELKVFCNHLKEVLTR